MLLFPPPIMVCPMFPLPPGPYFDGISEVVRLFFDLASNFRLAGAASILFLLGTLRLEWLVRFLAACWCSCSMAPNNRNIGSTIGSSLKKRGTI